MAILWASYAIRPRYRPDVSGRHSLLHRFSNASILAAEMRKSNSKSEKVRCKKGGRFYGRFGERGLFLQDMPESARGQRDLLGRPSVSGMKQRASTDGFTASRRSGPFVRQVAADIAQHWLLLRSALIRQLKWRLQVRRLSLHGARLSRRSGPFVRRVPPISRSSACCCGVG